jgi:pSer/pThr/pTyr-binding forkhead associated (FHA) protein
MNRDSSAPLSYMVICSPGEPDRGRVLSIGRAVDNSIVIAEKGVSRYHAIIEVHEGRFWLSDLNSKPAQLSTGP